MENSNPIMSSSSSSSPPKEYYYDVFLSFRGKDTRNNFTGFLHEALKQRGFHTFFDVDKLERGEFVDEGLMKAIKDSNCWIVVVSENYGSSIWCLTELAKMVELAEIVECGGVMNKRQILPIFYHVNADDLRELSGRYGNTMKDHDHYHVSETVQSWRKALKTVGGIAGWNVTKDTTDESKFIKVFIQQISIKLEVKTLHISPDVVGIKSRLDDFESNYMVPPSSSDRVQFIGICGMSGVGKSTLAKAYYNKNYYKFEGCCFLEKIRETCDDKKVDGLKYCQTQILSSILKGNDVKVDNVDTGIEMIRRRLGGKNVLIVLDNVNLLNQVKALAVQENNSFGKGSIIIVTTKERIVLRGSGIKSIYVAKMLDDIEALQLFSRKAFGGRNNPPVGFEEVCNKMIDYAKGLPLALEVLGSNLAGPDSTIDDFESKLKTLKKCQEGGINSVLQVGFDDLKKIDNQEILQEIFLDIACFFNKYNKNHVIEILESCGFSDSSYRINILIEKCLLSIDQHNDLDMHDLLEDMGKNIVRNRSRNEPGRQSRIWDVADLYKILENETETDKVEAIVTTVERSKKLTSFQAISQMKKLRLLMILDPDCENDSLTPDHIYLSNKLGCLQWDTFPYKCFPSSFRPNSLVKLKLTDSNVEKLWKKHATDLCKLKIIDLSHSLNLTKFEDFKVVKNLERLNLEGCIKLSVIDDSITSLEKLIILNLASCRNLEKLPKRIKGMESLQILNLYDCCKLCELPEDCGDLKSLKDVNVRDSGIRHLPSSIFLIQNLEVFCDEEVANSSLREYVINPPIGDCFLPDNFQTLKKLDLSDCNLKDKAFPEHFGNLDSLEELNLSKNPFSVLPPHIKELSKLKYLNLMYCKSLTHLRPDQLPSSLETLRVDYCTSLNTLLEQLEPCHFRFSTYCVDCTEFVKKRGGEMTALASLKRYIQKTEQEKLEKLEHKDPTHPTRPFDIVIPGSKIPAWFKIRSSKPSITIKLGSNKKWIGIAFSVCLPANSSDDAFSCMVRVHGKNKKWIVVTKKIYRRSSNHFWLSYSPRDFYLECLHNDCYRLEFSFYANESNNSCCGPCGVRLVYEEDIDQITTQNCNQSPEDENGEHYLRLKRSQNQKGIFRSILVATIVASLLAALRHKLH